MNGKSILITGASGFTGRHLISAARSEGYHCVALCRTLADIVPDADECVTADILDASAIEGVICNVQPHFVVHLAAISFVAHKSVSNIYQVNLVGALNLLDAISARAKRVEKVLIASSANVYGNAQTLPIIEDCTPQPVNHYGLSKFAMERASALYRDMPLTIVRPFNYTGLGQDDCFLIPKIVNAYKRKDATISLGNLNVSRDFSDVRDVVRAYLKLLGLETHRNIYNICSGTSHSLLSIIDRLNEMSEYEIVVESEPSLKRNEEIEELYGSCQLLEASIGQYRKYDLLDTLRWMYEN
jgi:GDP-6-deoxy-D-talose 4-dehydrogenase